MRPAIAAVLLVFLPALAAGAGEDILLITLDTTRADRLSCYGAPAGATPALDALARSGVRFDRAYTPVPVTLPSHAVLLTGLLPKDAGVRDNLGRLSGKVPAVADRLKRAGYRTAAFVSAFVLDRQFGLGCGFEAYDDGMTLDAGGGEKPNERPADATAAEAIRFIEQLPVGQGKIFLWINFYDPHHPYLAHADTPAGMGAYEGEVRFMDRWVGEVLKAWENKRSGLVIGVGDHGEMLGEHGEETHGVFLYESAVRVPLLMRLDGGPKGVVERAPVSTADVAATILSFAGASLDGLYGRSLLNAGASGFKPPHPALFFESFLPANSFGWTAPFAILKDGWKYIHLPRPELYRLEDDPTESKDRSGSDRATARDLLARLKRDYTTAYVPPEAADPEALKRLQSLGYKGGSVGGAARDPKDLVWVVPAMDRGERLEREGRGGEAEPIYRKILTANPENYTVMVKLGTLLQRTGRLEEARKQFLAARDLNPLFVHAHYNLASIALEEGDLNAAEQGFQRVAALDPRHMDARLQLARLAINAKRFDDARTHLGMVESLDPAEPNLFFLRGLLEAGRGNLPGAAVWFEKTLIRKPDYADAALNLAAARFALGEVDPAIRAYHRAIELDPGRSEAYLQLGAILLNAKDDTAGAARVFRAYLERFPGHPEAANVRELVEELAGTGY